MGYRLLSIMFLGIPFGLVASCMLRVAGVRDGIRSPSLICVTRNAQPVAFNPEGIPIVSGHVAKAYT
jgi:hypothetical protein